MKLFVFLLIICGLAMSFLLENDLGIEQENQRDDSVKLEKRIIEDVKSKRTRHWLWGNYPPPFFAGDKRPQNLPNIGAGTEIEQTLQTDPPGTPPYFVTLFDPARNIPFYSAYKVIPAQAGNTGTYRRKAANQNWRGPRGTPPNAVDKAYKAANRGGFEIDRGHMNPSAINSFDTNFMTATFTLTNAAPQFATSNQGPWQVFEKNIRDYTKNTCGKTGGILYLLTGTSDYGLFPNAAGKMIQDNTLKLPHTNTNFGGVTLVTPRALWTMGCCVWPQPGTVFGNWWPGMKVESFAVMTNNQHNRALLHQTQMSVADLEDLLTAPGTLRVNLFPGYAACNDPGNNVII